MIIESLQEQLTGLNPINNLSDSNITRLLDFYAKTGSSPFAARFVVAIARSCYEQNGEIYTGNILDNLLPADRPAERLLALAAEHLLGHSINHIAGYFSMDGEEIPLNGWNSVEKTLDFIDTVLGSEQIALDKLEEFIDMNVLDNHRQFFIYRDQHTPSLIPTWLTVHIVGAAENAYSPRKGASDVYFAVTNNQEGFYDFIIKDCGEEPIDPNFAATELLERINSYDPENGLTEGGNGFPLAVRELTQRGGKVTVTSSNKNIEYIYNEQDNCWTANVTPTKKQTEGTAVKFTVPKTQFEF